MTENETNEERNAASPNEDSSNKNAKDSEKPKTTQKTKKFKFECQKHAQCCKSSLLPVRVTFQDLKKWTEKGVLTAIFPHLSMKMEENKPPQIILQKYDADNNTINGCPLLDEDNNLCQIYHSMPGYCEAFPLLFDGANYRIADKKCSGLGKGEITRELLIKSREFARHAFEAGVETNLILPTLSVIWSQTLVRAQAQALKNLSEEDRKNLDKILGKRDDV